LVLMLSGGSMPSDSDSRRLVVSGLLAALLARGTAAGDSRRRLRWNRPCDRCRRVFFASSARAERSARSSCARGGGGIGVNVGGWLPSAAQPNENPRARAGGGGASGAEERENTSSECACTSGRGGGAATDDVVDPSARLSDAPSRCSPKSSAGT